MLIVYDKNDGRVVYTIDNIYSTDDINIDNSYGVKISYLEYGGSIKYMKVDVSTNDIVLIKGIRIKLDKDRINTGDTVHITIEANQGFEPFNLQIGNNMLYVTANEFDITFDYPGKYLIQMPNFDYFCLPKIVEVV
jgi:hypothetical protein